MFLLGCPLKNILEVRGGLAGSSLKRKLEEAVTSEARMVSVQGMQQESVSGAWMHSTLVFSSSQAITGNDVCKKQSCPWPGRTPVPPRKPSPTARGRSKICRRMSRPAGHMRAHTFRGPCSAALREPRCVSRTQPPGLAPGLGLTSAGLGTPRAADTSPEWLRPQRALPEAESPCPARRLCRRPGLGERPGWRGTATGQAAASSAFTVLCARALVSCQHFFQLKKTEVCFVLRGPEPSCLLREWPLTSVPQAEAGHRVSGQEEGRRKRRGILEGLVCLSCSLFPSLPSADGERNRRSLSPRKGCAGAGAAGEPVAPPARPAARAPPCTCSCPPKHRHTHITPHTPLHTHHTTQTPYTHTSPYTHTPIHTHVTPHTHSHTHTHRTIPTPLHTNTSPHTYLIPSTHTSHHATHIPTPHTTPLIYQHQTHIYTHHTHTHPQYHPNTKHTHTCIIYSAPPAHTHIPNTPLHTTHTYHTTHVPILHTHTSHHTTSNSLTFP